MQAMTYLYRRARLSALDFIQDGTALAATEFAVIVPLMLVMLFGTIEFSSAISVDRKVTLMARTLSDLTSQSTSVGDPDMNNFFAASNGIMTPYATGWPTPPSSPYPASPLSATISELYVDPTSLQARVQWSVGSAPRAQKSPVTIPSALAVAGTYLIFSEVSYTYTPSVGFVLKGGVNLSDVAYTRPRQSTCVYYSPATACTTL